MKIIQLLMTPNDATWQNHLLGLTDEGSVYSVGPTGEWLPYLAPVPAETPSESPGRTPLTDDNLVDFENDLVEADFARALERRCRSLEAAASDFVANVKSYNVHDGGWVHSDPSFKALVEALAQGSGGGEG